MKNYEDLTNDVQADLNSLGSMSPLIIDTKSMFGDNVIIDKNDYHIVYIVTKIGSRLKQYGQRETLSS